MAQSLADANKKGDQEKCKSAYGIEDKIITYCNANVVDDFNANKECKEPFEFCYICCDHEFGNMHIAEKDACKKMCDDLAAGELRHGEFQWGK